MKLFYPVDPKVGKRIMNSIDVSSYAEYPYNQFSPFTYSPEFKIPVPGQENVFSNSVEAIWQGLKIIDGKTDFSLFLRRPRKRKGDVQGHLYGKKILDIVAARKKIYFPAYIYHLNHNIPLELRKEVLALALKKGNLAFYDVESNLDPEDSSRPLAHSRFLSDYFNSYFKKKMAQIKSSIDDCAFHDHVPEHDTLAEVLERALKLYKGSSELEKMLIKQCLTENCDDELHQRYYDKLFSELNKL